MTPDGSITSRSDFALHTDQADDVPSDYVAANVSSEGESATPVDQEDLYWNQAILSEAVEQGSRQPEIAFKLFVTNKERTWALFGPNDHIFDAECMHRSAYLISVLTGDLDRRSILTKLLGFNLLDGAKYIDLHLDGFIDDATGRPFTPTNMSELDQASIKEKTGCEVDWLPLPTPGNESRLCFRKGLYMAAMEAIEHSMDSKESTESVRDRLTRLLAWADSPHVSALLTDIVDRGAKAAQRHMGDSLKKYRRYETRSRIQRSG